MDSFYSFFATYIQLLTAIGGLICIGLALYWVFNKKAKKKHLEALRKAYESMDPSDPDYSRAKSLYTAAALSSALQSYAYGTEAEHSDTSVGGGEDSNHV